MYPCSTVQLWLDLVDAWVVPSNLHLVLPCRDRPTPLARQCPLEVMDTTRATTDARFLYIFGPGPKSFLIMEDRQLSCTLRLTGLLLLLDASLKLRYSFWLELEF